MHSDIFYERDGWRRPPDYIIFRRRAYRGVGTNIKRKEEMDRIEDCCLHTGFVNQVNGKRGLEQKKGKGRKTQKLKKKKRKNN